MFRPLSKDRPELSFSNKKNNNYKKEINNKINYNNLFNLDNSTVPYYNENLEYLKQNINHEHKINHNYFILLDKIGYISRYLLKGDDYYRLYISKHSNKYFKNDDDDNVEEIATNNSNKYDTKYDTTNCEPDCELNIDIDITPSKRKYEAK